MHYIPAADRYHAHHDWLSSYHLFSFAEYIDYDNLHFGALRVFNDDTIAGKQGFPMHPHKEMEIVTLVQTGAVAHKDSMGNNAVVHAGEVQVMSAGTGVVHSEVNPLDNDLHLYQLWFIPHTQQRTPSYAQQTIPTTNVTLQLLVSPDGREGSLSMGADAFIYQGKHGEPTTITVQKGRGIFLYGKTGTLTVGEQPLHPGDQLRIATPGEYPISTTEDSSYILIDVAL